jgi:hypothetical protein
VGTQDRVAFREGVKTLLAWLETQEVVDRSEQVEAELRLNGVLKEATPKPYSRWLRLVAFVSEPSRDGIASDQVREVRVAKNVSPPKTASVDQAAAGCLRHPVRPPV